MKYTMRSASAERIFYFEEETKETKRPQRPRDTSDPQRPRDHKDRKTERARRPCDDAIDPCMRPHCGPRVLGSQGRKKSLPLNSNLEVLARPLVDLYPLAQ